MLETLSASQRLSSEALLRQACDDRGEIKTELNQVTRSWMSTNVPGSDS
jgi:hypothetical protein